MSKRFIKIASKIASDFMNEKEAFDMTLREWEIYHKQHPNAKKENHNIIPVPGDPYSSKTHKAYMRREKQAKKRYYKALQEKHPNFKPLMKKETIMQLLQHGEYSCISAGINPKSKEDKERARNDKNFIKNRTEQLRNDLDALGVEYTEIAGSYGSEETSFLISHTLDAKVGQKNRDNSFLINRNKYDNRNIIEELDKLGEKYNQDSVAHGRKGLMEWHFTTGKHAGKSGIGTGTSFMRRVKDFYSEARIGDSDYTMWSCNMSRLFDAKGRIDPKALVDCIYFQQTK